MSSGDWGPDWELDYYSRPILESDGKKRWELLISSTPEVGSEDPCFRFVKACPATSVNSIWLREALEQAFGEANDQGFAAPRRLRCWRGSMRTMVQRAAEGLALELVPSRRCYALVNWLQEREREVYPLEEGYMAGPLAPAPLPIRAVAVPLPEAARGDRWAWATLPLKDLAEALDWEMGFQGLVPLPEGLDPEAPVPGIRLFSASRSLAMAGWMAGLEPVRLEIADQQLVLEAGLEDRWLLTNLEASEAKTAAQAFADSRQRAGGLQFVAIQADAEETRFEGFWLLRDLPDA
ncbi:Tab2/Atab2 family RNA-binding protein [Cyanobium sp. HWJ4-Hawea]|uniref:Tab2/Atab2 family RNA-binding protein n=1 Tax=Cyanobium sp. HWJ4-Hawea TaxID=2823713 RepID=UPI0020CFC8A3|nr:Tab2/Atab2 family RNA-binding protein [Cyanobium sp. HWJ4-Hawea]MCP9810247.1 Tab2/Atab2 family RNA-binding protein [Cyanobium sp. HWJ4-Hawea]